MQRKQAFKILKTPETSFIPQSNNSLFFATPKGKQSEYIHDSNLQTDANTSYVSQNNSINSTSNRQINTNPKKTNTFYDFCKAYFIHTFIATMLAITIYNQNIQIYNEINNLQKQILLLNNVKNEDIQDYACIRNNAHIDIKRTTKPYKSSFLKSMFSSKKLDPNIILAGNYMQGECYSFPSNKSASIFINFSAAIYIKNIQIYHPNTKNRSSAIKNFVVYGCNNMKLDKLGEFEYDINGKLIQTYTLNIDKRYKSVQIRVISNHGHKKYTCMYKVSVNGCENVK